MPVTFKSAKTHTITVIGFILTAVLLVICAMSGKIVGLITGQHLSAPALFFVSRISYWIILAFVFLYVLKIEKKPLLLWEERSYKARFYFYSILVIIASVLVGSAIIGVAAHYAGSNTHSNAVQAMYGFGVPLKLFTVVTAAVVEELIFRGYLMARLQLFFKSKYWPIIISALLFGLAHMRYGTVVNMAIPALIGFIFGWFYEKYRNVKILIICHFILDFFSLILIHPH